MMLRPESGTGNVEELGSGRLLNTPVGDATIADLGRVWSCVSRFARRAASESRIARYRVGPSEADGLLGGRPCSCRQMC
jgi:hypothetical protein